LKNLCVVTWSETRCWKTKARSYQETVIVIEDTAFSAWSLLEVFISIGKCPTAADIPVVFFLSMDLNYTKISLYHNHVNLYIKYT